MDWQINIMSLSVLLKTTYRFNAIATKMQHRETHGSSCIYSRGWPCWTSMRGEALGPEKARCPSVGECQDREAEMGALVSRGRWEGTGVLEGK